MCSILTTNVPLMLKVRELIFFSRDISTRTVVRETTGVVQFSSESSECVHMYNYVEYNYLLLYFLSGFLYPLPFHPPFLDGLPL